MKVSASIELAVQLAGQETIAAQFKEIAPEHLLMGLLKLAELSVEEVDKVAPGADAAKQLAAEVNAIREELVGRGLDTTAVRRQLRSALGNGGCPYDGGRLHRSPASREVFDAAARLADDAGSESLLAVHLLEALFASPTPTMVKVLGDALTRRPARASRTPLLDACPLDLTRLAADGRLESVDHPYPPAASRALIRALSEQGPAGILLITDDDDTARDVVAAAAQSIATKECPASLRNRRIIDVTMVPKVDNDTAGATGYVEKLLAEAAAAPEVILVLPAADLVSPAGQDNRWIDVLKETLSRGLVHCICRVSPMVYQEHMKRDRAWRRIAHALWIEDKKPGEVPLEL